MVRKSGQTQGEHPTRTIKVTEIKNVLVRTRPQFETQPHRVQTGSEAHPASYPMGTGGPYLGDKAAGA